MGFDPSRWIDATIDAHTVDLGSDHGYFRWGDFRLPERVTMRRQDKYSCEGQGQGLQPDHVESSG